MIFGCTDLSLGIFNSAHMMTLCEKVSIPQTFSTMNNSLIKVKKVTDFPVQMQFISDMLGVLFANQSLCLFTLVEKGELMMLLRIPSDIDDPTRYSPLMFFKGGLAMARLQDIPKEGVSLIIEQPRPKHDEIEVNIIPTLLGRSSRSGLDSCHVAPCIYKGEGLVCVTSIPKDRKHLVQFVWTSIK